MDVQDAKNLTILVYYFHHFFPSDQFASLLAPSVDFIVFGSNNLASVYIFYGLFGDWALFKIIYKLGFIK